jgi:hypothetical protein
MLPGIGRIPIEIIDNLRRTWRGASMETCDALISCKKWSNDVKSFTGTPLSLSLPLSPSLSLSLPLSPSLSLPLSPSLSLSLPLSPSLSLSLPLSPSLRLSLSPSLCQISYRDTCLQRPALGPSKKLPLWKGNCSLAVFQSNLLCNFIGLGLGQPLFRDVC